MVDSANRWLALEGLDNVRDVGGLPLRDGGQTRPGVLLRSASLHYVTPADVEHLVDVFGLSLVLDLRTRRELDRDGPTAVARAGVPTVWLNFHAEDGEVLPRADDGDLDPVLRTYLGYLAERPENVVDAVRRLAAADAGPALVHCAAGKDRTGVLVALVLDTVGVQRTSVLADYVLSAEQVPALYRRWTTASGEPMPDRPHPAPAAHRGDGRGAVPAGRGVRHRAGGWRGRLAAGPGAGRGIPRPAAQPADGLNPTRLPAGMPRWEQPGPTRRRPRWT